MIINGEITSLHISFTNSHVEGPFMKDSKMAFAISPLSTAAIEKEGKQEKSVHRTSESSSLLQNKINNSTLEEETHTFLLNLNQSESVSLRPFIH